MGDVTGHVYQFSSSNMNETCSVITMNEGFTSHVINIVVKKNCVNELNINCTLIIDYIHYYFILNLKLFEFYHKRGLFYHEWMTMWWVRSLEIFFFFFTNETLITSHLTINLSADWNLSVAPFPSSLSNIKLSGLNN